MTLGLRAMSITRLDYCDTTLFFPPLTAEWLKEAELVCLKKIRLDTLRKAIGAKDFPVGSTEKRTIDERRMKE